MPGVDHGECPLPADFRGRLAGYDSNGDTPIYRTAFADHEPSAGS